MRYILDTNIFIEAQRGLLPVDVAISFWDKLKQLNETQSIYSLDKVKEEIFKHNDDLANWMKNNFSTSFFLSFKENVLEKISVIIEYVNKSTIYTDKAKKEFCNLDTADVYIIAYAMTYDDIKIVTRETSKIQVGTKNKSGKVSIPDICKYFKITCIQPQQMFRELGETF